MNINLDDIAGFDAAAEEIREVYNERDRLRDENEDLKAERDRLMDTRGEFARDILDTVHCAYYNPSNVQMLEQLAKYEANKLYAGRNRQEDFTEEAASILGVHPGDLSLSDILEALRKLKREEKLDEMNCEIIASLKEERDQSQRAFSGEHSRRLAAEKYISDTFQRAAKELGMTRIPDGIDKLCDEIADLRSRAFCQQALWDRIFWESMCDVMEMDPDDATPSDILAMIGEAKKRLISLLALNPDTATWTDIYDDIKAEQKDHCNLISESYKMRNELSNTKDILSGLSNTCTDLKNERNEALHKLKRCEKLNNMNSGIIADLKAERDNLQRYISDRLSKICSALGIEYSTDTTFEYILDTIDDLVAERKRAGIREAENADLVGQVCELYSALGLDFDDSQDFAIHKIKSLQDDRARLCVVDRRRQHWVRRYKEEHERAVNLDKLYREWKDKYETYYKKTSNMAEQNESLMASYMAVKNTAHKQKDILKVVCRYLAGKDNLPDKDIVVRLNEMWTKENGWDGLVEHYGAKVIRELVDACDDEITETTRKDLGDMLST